MTDHNLDDLIIDNIEPKNRKTKSFLTIIALFIVVLIVAIILTRTILKTPQSEQLVLKEDPAEYIAPELKLQPKPEPVKKEVTPKLEKIIEKKPSTPQPNVPVTPIEPKPKVEHKLENIDNNLYEVPKPRSIGVIPPEKKPEKPVVKPAAVEVPVEKKPVVKQPVIQALEIPQPVVKKPVVEAPVEKKPVIVEKPVVTKPVKKETIVKTPVPVITEPVIEKPVAKKPVVSTTKYYIQVGSFSKDPSPRFLSVIKRNGFNYHLTKPNTKGTRKLHIGPYNTRSEVNAALKEVKDRINKSAFVVKK